MKIVTVIILGFCFISLSTVCPQAKGDDDQTQIILLNDTAAALEDSNPELSKEITQIADEKENEWEKKNANKDVIPDPITDKTKLIIQNHINLLREASFAIKPTYPVIAKSLSQMAKQMNRTIENE